MGSMVPRCTSWMKNMWCLQEDCLYITGSSSQVIDIEEPDLQRFPRFAAARGWDCTLEAGDALYIPPLWFHHVACEGFCASVNMFWRDLPPQLYERKDLYGNRDVAAFGKAAAAVDQIGHDIKQLPQPYCDFYLNRLRQKLVN